MIRDVAILSAQALRVRRFSLIAWTASISLLFIAYAAMFPSVRKVDFEQVFAQYPKELLKAFGVESLAQINTLMGFLKTELFGFMLPLAIVFLPIGVIVNTTSRAEERGYLNALFSTSVARWELVVAAAVAATVALLVPVVAIIAITLLTAQIVGASIGFSALAEACLSLLPLGAFIGSIAIVVIGLTRRHGMATAVAGGTLVVMYLMQVLASFLKFFDDVKGFSAFHYYIDWVNHGMDWLQWLAMFVVAGALTLIGALLFERRDVGS